MEITLKDGLAAEGLYLMNDKAKVEEFIKAGSYVNTRGVRGMTPLMLAVHANCDIDIVRDLLIAGADIKARSATGKTALMYAASHSYPAVINLLLQKGAGIDDVQESTGWTSLFFALQRNREMQVVTCLLDAGADINHKDLKGQTPLMLASQYSTDTRLIDMLIRQGADPTIMSGDGSTALDYARENTGNASAQAMLMAHTGGNLTIRHIGAEDYAAIASYVPSVNQMDFLANVALGQNASFILITPSGERVGCILAAEAGPMGIIWGFAVAPDYQGKGWEKQLLSHAEQALASRGAKKFVFFSSGEGGMESQAANEVGYRKVETVVLVKDVH